MSKPRILCVDDEEDLLAGLRLNLRKQFDVTTATSGAEGLELIDAAAQDERGQFSAIVSDMRMPHMNGAVFLREALARTPSTPRILLTGQADLESTIAAINEGKIFRFLSKPCEPALLAETLQEAMELERLREAERVLLDQTLRGTVTMLTEVLGLVSTSAYVRTSRVRELVTHTVTGLGLAPSWDLDVASLLCQIGVVVVPEALDDGDTASHQHAETAANLIANIPRLEAAAAMVRQQHLPDSLIKGPLEEATRPTIDAEILRAALAFDELISKGMSRTKAAEALESAASPPPRSITDALRSVTPTEDQMVEAVVEPKQLSAGMELLEDLAIDGGAKLAGAGTTLTGVLIERIHAFASSGRLTEPVPVMAPRSALSRLKVR